MVYDTHHIKLVVKTMVSLLLCDSKKLGSNPRPPRSHNLIGKISVSKSDIVCSNHTEISVIKTVISRSTCHVESHGLIPWLRILIFNILILNISKNWKMWLTENPILSVKILRARRNDFDCSDYCSNHFEYIFSQFEFWKDFPNHRFL